MNIQLFFPFLLYLLVMIVIGWFFYSRTKNVSDYILGGRTLNSWIASLSAQASDMSGWLLLGLPGYAYLAGVEAFWIAGGLALGTYLNWTFVAPRLRSYTQKYGDAITLPHYFENRFQHDNRLLRMTSAFFILIFFLIYTASGFVAGAKLFHTVFGLPYVAALGVGVLVIISYTFLGGFWAVSWTDFIQGSIMFIAILFVPAMVIGKLGGLGQLIQEVQAANSHLLTLTHDASGQPLSWIVIVSLTAWGLGYFGQPHILARFMAIRDVAAIPKARLIAMVWVLSTLFGAVLVGVVGSVFIDPPLAAAKAETVFMVLVNSTVAPLGAGFLLAAILAAIMSTADSQLLVASSAMTEDFYHVILHKKASQKELVWISRGSVVFIAVIAFVIALNPDSSVLELVAYAWAGFGAAFGPVILFSLFWRRMTGAGALAGIVAGGLTVLVWKQLSGGLFDLYEIVPGFILSSVSILFVSALNKRPTWKEKSKEK